MAALKLFWIVLLVLLTAALLTWLRAEGGGTSVVRALPLLGGHKPSILWDGASAAMLLITLWGIGRLRRRH